MSQIAASSRPEARLAQRLLALDLTQLEASVLADVSTSTISRWLTYGETPTIKIAERLAAALECSVSDLGWRPTVAMRAQDAVVAVARARGIVVDSVRESRDMVRVVLLVPKREIERVRAARD
ncbi:helix-turn-helix transcriptional regulator [Roseomonas stagni]|uniref:Helix-turn-helix transcriptional regulator n=1 Tax=Falsiroseomonas algicola TaxID=2716930 RepID=A0A6M1LVA0_9PROT|nr:helix-turn-helix transcriptional regulator [Falsiroseomonas algicola]NGM24396.1 helix-turn-helix transcriptional regulator [Falsiroseomonas algicola]